MSQRRSSSSSGKGDETSDLLDMKALAARARAQQTGSHPVPPQNPAELSGVRPRRDSVIGARLTPPPRATSSQLPNWFWGVLGCLSVLLVGFVGLFVLGRSGKLAPYLEDLAPAAAAVPPVAEVAPAPTPEAVAPAPAAEPEVPARPARHEAKVAEPAPAAEEPAPVAAAEPVPSAAASAPAHEPPAPKAAAHVAKIRAAKTEAAPAAPPGDQPQAQGAEADDDAPEAKAPATAKPARTPAPAKAAADTGDDDQSAPGQDAVEAALDALSTRVRGCFVKYQIKGTARVRLIATPAGTAESVNVTGDFEDTPTGLCVEAVVSGAKLPSFKGAPLKLSQSYQLR
jgi:hypothetical protein